MRGLFGKWGKVQWPFLLSQNLLGLLEFSSISWYLDYSDSSFLRSDGLRGNKKGIDCVVARVARYINTKFSRKIEDVRKFSKSLFPLNLPS